MGIEDKETLLCHPVVGSSWEGFAIEQLLAAAPQGVHGFFYRTSGGAEIDLLLHFPGGRLWAVEVKRSLAPSPKKGFFSACADLSPERRISQVVLRWLGEPVQLVPRRQPRRHRHSAGRYNAVTPHNRYCFAKICDTISPAGHVPRRFRAVPDLADRTEFRNQVLATLLAGDLLELTIPDKPRRLLPFPLTWCILVAYTGGHGCY